MSEHTDIEQIGSSLEIDTSHKLPLFDKLRRNLGWDSDFLQKINDPTHQDLKDMDLMVKALHEIQTSGKKITVLPDFDMDGIAAGVATWAGLAELEFDVDLYVPDYNLGHDISPLAIDDLMAKHPDTQAIITCDGGVNSHAGMARGKELGLTMLVTDHHIQEDTNSPADIIINPMRLDETYAFGGICGAHVAWQVLESYVKTYCPSKIRDINLLRVFAGIGTVSDVMPLLYENRAIVKDAITILKMLYVPLEPEDLATPYNINDSLLLSLLDSGKHSDEYLAAMRGLAVVLQGFREHGKLEPVFDSNGQLRLDAEGNPVLKRRTGKLRRSDDINEDFFGFYLAPTFNAIRRIEGDIEHAFGIFTEQSTEQKLEHIKTVLDYNEIRKSLVEQYMEELEDTVQPYAPWVWLTSAPGGMRGLLAAELMSQLGHPVAVISKEDTSFSGSMRAPAWFDIISVMNAANYHTVGHAQACGVFIQDEDTIKQFITDLKEQIEVQYGLAQTQAIINGTRRSDLILGDDETAEGDLNNIDDITDLASIIEMYAPFGKGFPAPRFELVLDMGRCSVKTLGADGSHLRINTNSGIKVLGWSKADMLEELEDMAKELHPNDRKLKVLASLSLNHFQGMVSPQFIIDSIIEEDIDIEEIA